MYVYWKKREIKLNFPVNEEINCIIKTYNVQVSNGNREESNQKSKKMWTWCHVLRSINCANSQIYSARMQFISSFTGKFNFISRFFQYTYIYVPPLCLHKGFLTLGHYRSFLSDTLS
jgi:hypothetical protein